MSTSDRNPLVHGSNLEQKESHRTKYRDSDVLRQQKNTDREYRYEETYMKNPINLPVVQHLFDKVRKYLTTDWTGGIEQGIKRGWLIDE
jgi:hypothetical protein